MPERHLTHDAEDAARQHEDSSQRKVPRDVGRTSGGGSLGHKQPADVADATNIRNEPASHRGDEPAHGEVVDR